MPTLSHQERVARFVVRPREKRNVSPSILIKTKAPLPIVVGFLRPARVARVSNRAC
jgi:hypothetical protein